MSTCPDSDLYSAYADGEVPSPWKEKLEAHLASCQQCKKTAERFAALHRAIAAGMPTLGEFRLKEGYQRLLARRVAGARNAARSGGGTLAFPSWMHDSVRIPVPALAAMLLAAVFLPAWFTVRALKTTSPVASYPASLSELTAPNSGTQPAILNASTPVYSPDLPVGAYQTIPVDGPNRHISNIINYARTFNPREESVEVERMTSVRIPDVRSLLTTDESLFASSGILPLAASFDR